MAFCHFTKSSADFTDIAVHTKDTKREKCFIKDTYWEYFPVLKLSQFNSPCPVLLLSHCSGGDRRKTRNTHMIYTHTPTWNVITQLRTTGVKRLNNLHLLEDFDLTFIQLVKSLLHSQAKWHSGMSNPLLQECLYSVAEFCSTSSW